MIQGTWVSAGGVKPAGFDGRPEILHSRVLHVAVKVAGANVGRGHAVGDARVQGIAYGVGLAGGDGRAAPVDHARDALGRAVVARQLAGAPRPVERVSRIDAGQSPSGQFRSACVACPVDSSESGDESGVVHAISAEVARASETETEMRSEVAFMKGPFPRCPVRARCDGRAWRGRRRAAGFPAALHARAFRIPARLHPVCRGPVALRPHEIALICAPEACARALPGQVAWAICRSATGPGCSASSSDDGAHGGSAAAGRARPCP